jgi:hypothetical protein
LIVVEQSIVSFSFKHLLTAPIKLFTMADPVGHVLLVPGGPPGAPAPTSYLEYYQDDANDNAMGNYAAIMGIFSVPVAGAVATPVQVADAVFAAAVADPQAFVALVVDVNHPNGHVSLFHQLQRYAPKLGTPTEYDNNGYVFFGDLTNGQAPPSVEWPANAFHQAGGVTIQVPTRETLDQMLGGDPTLNLVGPFGNDDAGTEVLRVRHTILVPFCYVRLLLQTPLTPKEAWVQVAGAIIADGNHESCAPLIDWLRAAITRQAKGQASRVQIVHPTIPLMLPALIKQRWKLVLSDVPALSGGATLAAGTAIASSLMPWSPTIANFAKQMNFAVTKKRHALPKSASVRMVWQNSCACAKSATRPNCPKCGRTLRQNRVDRMELSPSSKLSIARPKVLVCWESTSPSHRMW